MIRSSRPVVFFFSTNLLQIICIFSCVPPSGHEHGLPSMSQNHQDQHIQHSAPAPPVEEKISVLIAPKSTNTSVNSTMGEHHKYVTHKNNMQLTSPFMHETEYMHIAQFGSKYHSFSSNNYEYLTYVEMLMF